MRAMSEPPKIDPSTNHLITAGARSKHGKSHVPRRSSPVSPTSPRKHALCGSGQPVAAERIAAHCHHARSRPTQPTGYRHQNAQKNKPFAAQNMPRRPERSRTTARSQLGSPPPVRSAAPRAYQLTPPPPPHTHPTHWPLRTCSSELWLRVLTMMDCLCIVNVWKYQSLEIVAALI
eukprot:COSAG01_NODE_403_length_17482_cov_77.249597_6_plen_176_part_00